MSVFPSSGLVFLLLAASVAHAEGLFGDKVLTTYAIAMHGKPALPTDFSRLPYADPNATKGGRLALAYQGTFDSLNPYNLSAGSTAQGSGTELGGEVPYRLHQGPRKVGAG